MAKSKSIKDIYGQTVQLTVAEAVANTGILDQFTTNVVSDAYIGMLIHRVEYNFGLTNLAAAADGFTFGLALWNVGTSGLAMNTTKGIFDWNQFQVSPNGAALNNWIQYTPFIKDFSTLPGGGKICHPSSLWGFVMGANLAAVMTVYMKVFYTLFDIDDSFYRELYQMQLQDAILSS